MKNLLPILFFLSCGVCGGQNLVPNPSFEDTISCYGGIFSTMFFQVGDWTEINTADYYNSCNGSVPNNIFGFRYPASGNAYAGLYTHSDGNVLTNYREFIGIPLTTPLVIGQKYFVSLKVSRAIGGSAANCATNNMGVLFTNTIYFKDTVISYPNTPFINNFAHVYSSSIISDSLNWTIICGSFISDSVYHNIFVGNFFDDQHTDSISPNGAGCFSYYFIDDIYVSTDSLTCYSPVGIERPKQTADVSLFPNPFSTQLTFSLSNNEQATIIVYDIFSRQILQQAFTSSTTLSTAQMPAGIYFYELGNNKGLIRNGKVIKQ